jgi:hypothetical protein
LLLKTGRRVDEYKFMSQTPNGNGALTSLEEIQQTWRDVTLRVSQLEAERTALEQENKTLRSLMERMIEHRQKSHGELVGLLTTLVSKLPINDVGVVVSRLVEHNSHVSEVCASMARGKLEDNLLQPPLLKALDKTKRDLTAALQAAVEELTRLDAPLEAEMLAGLVAQPESFFSPPAARAMRGFVKGQVPRERVVKDFGEAALALFKDVTTDVKFNPRPRPEEVMLAFTPEFEAALAQKPELSEQRTALLALFQKVRQSKESRAQKNAFLRLSFVLELLHYYDNQSTESPDVVFAQRLPPLIEQIALPGEGGALDEKLIQEAETLLAFIIMPGHRSAVINNVGKGGGLARTLRYTLTFRAETHSELDPLTQECVKHLLSPDRTPDADAIAAVVRLFHPPMREAVLRAIHDTDRLAKEKAHELAKALIPKVGLQVGEEQLFKKLAPPTVPEPPPGWELVKQLIANRAAPAEVVAAIRRLLHGQYDVDQVKLCWLTLTEGDPLVFVRVFCLLPYLPDGQTDPLARAIMETFVTRLTHEKYVAIYTKVIHALRNMFKVKADSPALVNFVTLVKWVEPSAAAKIAADIGMPAL